LFLRYKNLLKKVSRKMSEIVLTTIELLAMRFPRRKSNSQLPVNNIKGEEWKQLIDYVHVSNLGRVKKSFQDKRGKEIEHLYRTQIYNGHLYVQYQESIDRKFRKVGRIILMAFKPLENYNGQYILFKDCNPLNCALDNLQWASLQEIHQHLKNNGLGHGKPKKTYLILCIRRNGKPGWRRVNISPKTVNQIRKLYNAGISQTKIAEITGTKQNAVKNIVNGIFRKDG